MVGKAVDTRLDGARLAFTAAKVVQRAGVTQDEVEAVVVRGSRREPGEVLGRRDLGEQVFGDEAAPGKRGRTALRGIAKVGDRGEATVTRDTHPGATRLEVAAGKNVRMIRPPVGGLRRT